MNLLLRLRRGEGPFWGRLKRLALSLLSIHIPVTRSTRPLFSFLYHVHVCTRETIQGLLRFFWYEPPLRSQCARVGSGFRMEMLPYILGQGRIEIGNRVFLAGKSTFMFGNRWNDRPVLIIGDDSFVGHDCNLSVASSIRIGNHCLLAGGVHISDYDGHPTDAILRRTEPAPPEAIRPVVIGDDVWIGANAKILKGVTIGDRSIVGAGAVVTRSVPSDSVVAGNPARVVKTLGVASPQVTG